MRFSRREFNRIAPLGGLAALPASRVYARARPSLLVLLVAEQFRSTYLDRLESAFGAGGFRRLMTEGAWFPDCRHLCSTFTETGLATLATGAWPGVHGIVAGSWFDAEKRTVIHATAGALRATTFAAQFARLPRARVYSIALSEGRAAMAAAAPAAALIFPGSSGEFVSPNGPPWLEEYARLHPVENMHGARWMALGAAPSAPPLRTLNWDPAHPDEFQRLYRSSPFAQLEQFELARDCIRRENLGRNGTPDLLVISAGSAELLGYETGGQSPLMDQMVLQLDRQIEGTLDLLDNTAGSANYCLAFAAAHGAPPDPGDRRNTMAVSGEKLAQAIDREVTVEKYIYPFLYLKEHGRDARSRAARAASRQPPVAGWYTADGLCSHAGGWARRFRNSFERERSGDLMLAYRPEYVEEFAPGRGVSYGSLYNYDVQVPLLLFGPPFRAGTYEQRVEAIDLAPTLARVAGVEPPSSSTGRVLAEALAT